MKIINHENLLILIRPGPREQIAERFPQAQKAVKDPGYEFVKAWGEKGSSPGQFSDPTGIAVANGEVFVADSRNGRIQVFDLDGNFKRQFGRPGKDPGELGRPMNLTVHDGELYVADFYGQRVQKLKPDGTFLTSFGRKGVGPGQFNHAIAVAVAQDGTVFVADFLNNRIEKWWPKRRIR